MEAICRGLDVNRVDAANRYNGAQSPCMPASHFITTRF